MNDLKKGKYDRTPEPSAYHKASKHRFTAMFVAF